MCLASRRHTAAMEQLSGGAERGKPDSPRRRRRHRHRRGGAEVRPLDAAGSERHVPPGVPSARCAERRIVVPPEHLFPAGRVALGRGPLDARIRSQGGDRTGAVQRLCGRPWHPRRGPPGDGAGCVHQRLPRDVADHPRRGRLRVGARRSDDRQRAGRHDHRAVRRRRAAVRADGAHARVPPRPRHAQRDPDS